ncbi:fibronectin type III domain protein [Dictyocaulus viviparus]|uniref:Fibronectin type III domain protein n=1 Tax=Dictyocaulus viviparus TaxID=29172 RepID=A0A0D8XIV6_DICVI|nr:fibronectin type III domain protein [Dictyocaulus viviparus]
MHKLYVVAMLLSKTVAFPMLPYIQLDYAHYFRLAQCQAMCTERCESGCHQHRRLYARGSRNLSQNSPMNDGLRFWAASSTGSAKTGSNVMSTVQLLCQNSVVDEEFGESVEGFVSISLIRPVRPIRFVIQWKQRTDMIGHFEDSQWITASVEHDSLFKVRGLIPGIQYRFMVTAVSVNGKLGDTVTSDWTEVSNGVMPKPPANSLTLSNGYNSNRGVMAQLQWTRTFFDSCYYKLQLSNGSYQVTTDITLDSSPSILLPHLQFDTNYLVTIAAVSADKTQTSKSITTHFRSLQCRDVHGHGSLQCLPEPVTDLTIVVRPNGTGLVSWNPSTDPQNILFYQLIYFAVTQNDGCQIRKQIFNVKATVTSTEVIFPGNQCEYLVRLINYDLLGRDASAEVSEKQNKFSDYAKVDL